MKEELRGMALSDIKAAYDFIRIRISDLKEQAERDYVDVEKMQAFKELKSIESLLHGELMNRTGFLFKYTI